jgi:hypothetical protein
MTGDEFGGVRFPKILRGYDVRQVDGLLSARARLLDAGFSPAIFTLQPTFAKVMRGYEPMAVDRFFDALASDNTPQTSPPGLMNPWRVVCGEPEPQDGSGARDRDRRAWRPGAARRQYARDCQAEWLRVSDLPGTHLQRISGRTSTILGSYGQVLMTCRGETLTVGDGGQMLRNDRAHAQIVDAGTGDPVLRWIGDHSYHQARAVVLLPEQRWVRFPVQGTGRGDAVMRAIDESDTEVLWFRKVKRAVMEAVVRPYCDVTSEILCLTECAASWLDAYFRAEGGGGG